MPAQQSAYELVCGSMRLIGALAVGETPTADEGNDGLDLLNDILETWSTETLSFYGSLNETFTTVPGQAIYTIGPAGNFDTTRPVRISGAFSIVNDVNFPIDLIGIDEYNRFTLPTQPGQIIEKLVYVNDFPFGQIIVWPVPTVAVPLVLDTDRVLTQIPTLATQVSFPPGYYVALRYTLAVALAPEYGVPVSPDIAGAAKTLTANIKRANKQKLVSQFDAALTDCNYPIWQRGW